MTHSKHVLIEHPFTQWLPLVIKNSDVFYSNPCTVCEETILRVTVGSKEKKKNSGREWPFQSHHEWAKPCATTTAPVARLYKKKILYCNPTLNTDLA